MAFRYRRIGLETATAGFNLLSALRHYQPRTTASSPSAPSTYSSLVDQLRNDLVDLIGILVLDSAHNAVAKHAVAALRQQLANETEAPIDTSLLLDPSATFVAPESGTLVDLEAQGAVNQEGWADWAGGLTSWREAEAMGEDPFSGEWMAGAMGVMPWENGDFWDLGDLVGWSSSGL
ncbi:hypothetical protein JCM11251_006801 [Rhodosporidiobolus azoricus]